MFPALEGSITAPPPEPIRPMAQTDGPVPPPISIDSHPGINESRTLDHETLSPSATSSANARYYVVKQGDTLTGLAIRFLGRSSRYKEIFEANRDVLSSPDALRANIRIRIPPKDRSQVRDHVDNATSHRRTPIEPFQPASPSPDRVARDDHRTDAEPISRPRSDVPVSRDLFPRADSMSRAAPPENISGSTFREQPTESEPVPFATSDESGLELGNIFSGPVTDDVAAPRESRPQSSETSHPRFVPYGRSPLGFDGPFRESEELARAPAAPPPPKRVRQAGPTDLPDPDDLRPISVPEQPKPRAESPAPSASGRELPSVRKYQIKPGDSLERIAVCFYGTRKAVNFILGANRDRIANPNRVPVGLTIVLP